MDDLILYLNDAQFDQHVAQAGRVFYQFFGFDAPIGQVGDLRFRHLETSRHLGKIVLDLVVDNPSSFSSPFDLQVKHDNSLCG